MIPQDKIEQIKDANDIVEVLSDYLQVKKSGSNYKTLCPFHQEKTPSFMISPAKQIFHCFGCHAGGNVFTFLQKIENISFIKNVKILGKRAGIELDYQRSDERHSEKEKLIEINREALEFFAEAVKKSEKTQKYLKERGISLETAGEFRLGYAPDGNALLTHLKAKGYSEELILQSWLCQKKEYGIIDAFRDRLIFPILNISGEPIAFGARVFDSSLPKYINSAETAIYIKGRNLYNLNNAKKQRQDSIIVVEGYMDAITLYSGGIKNVVATLGTAMTPDQARLLKRHVSKIVMAYDMDEPGRLGAMRGGEVAFGEELEVKIASYMDAKDPDEFLKKYGAEALRERFLKADGIVEYRGEYLISQGDIKDPYYKERVLKELADLVNKTDNIVVRHNGIEYIKSKLSVSATILLNYIDLLSKNVAEFKNAVSEQDEYGKRKANEAERGIIGCALDAIGKEDEKIILKHLFSKREISGITYADFANKVSARILEKLELYFKKGEREALKKIELEYIEDDEVIKEIAEILGEETARAKAGSGQDTNKAMRIINDCFASMEIEKIEMKINSLQTEIKKAELEKNDTLVKTLHKEKLQLQKIIQQRGEEFE